MVILQSFAASFSALSSLTIINLVKINKLETRTAIIILFAILNFFAQLIKVCIAGNDPWMHHDIWMERLTQNPQISTKSKAVLLGLVDCTFDIIAAIAILNDVEFSTFSTTSWLIALGTFIGLSEELIELVIELMFCGIESMDSISSSAETPIAYLLTLCFCFIEIIGAFVEISISIYLSFTVSNNSRFRVAAIIVLGIVGCCLCAGSFIFVFISYDRLKKSSKKVINEYSPKQKKKRTEIIEIKKIKKEKEKEREKEREEALKEKMKLSPCLNSMTSFLFHNLENPLMNIGIPRIREIGQQFAKTNNIELEYISFDYFEFGAQLNEHDDIMYIVKNDKIVICIAGTIGSSPPVVDYRVVGGKGNCKSWDMFVQQRLYG